MMRSVVIALIFGAAIAAWLIFACGTSGSDSNDAAIAERFTPGKEDKRNSYSSDIMDTYKDIYGKYPQTEVLVHYRDAAMDGGLSLEEVKARIRSDGGTPPGLVKPSVEAEQKIASLASSNPPPKPGDVPYAPKPAPDPARNGGTQGLTAPPAADVVGLPSKLMGIAMQLSALAEELQAVGKNSDAPKGFERFTLSPYQYQ